jgi:hypothetical protein
VTLRAALPVVQPVDLEAHAHAVIEKFSIHVRTIILSPNPSGLLYWIVADFMNHPSPSRVNSFMPMP